jgi:YggT family protein
LPDVICSLLGLYFYVLIARMIFSWIPVTPGTTAAQINHVLLQLTEPVLGPVRRLIGPVRIGSIGLDLSATIVIFAWFPVMGLIGC